MFLKLTDDPGCDDKRNRPDRESWINMDRIVRIFPIFPSGSALHWDFDSVDSPLLVAESPEQIMEMMESDDQNDDHWAERIRQLAK